MGRVIRFYISAFLVVSALSCHAQPDKNNDKVSVFIKQKADSLYKSERVPGIFIGVLNNGERHYYNFGFANPDLKMPFDSATLFEIGSLTKTFTAYVLESILKEKGINDSSTIIKYLPDSLQRNKALERISFLSLLNHTSGLPRLPTNMDLVANAMTPYDGYTSDDLFAYLKTSIPKPDGKSNYSNLGGGLAGVLAERISGKTYAALLDEYIFLPFKMVTPDKSISKTENKSQGYFENKKSDYWNMDVMAPAGGLKCSANEMLTYLQLIAKPGTENSKSIIDQLLEPTVSINPSIKVCRAWHTLEQKEKPIIYWHNGGTYGFSTFGAFIKGESKSIIVVVNQFNKNTVSDGLGIAIMKKMLE